MLVLIELVARVHAKQVVFQELALTTFFPRWAIDADALPDGFFDISMPSQENPAAVRCGTSA